MSAGLPQDMQTINSRAGGTALSLRNALSDAQSFLGFLQGLGQDGLVAEGFTATDATTLLAAYTDLSNLAAVAHGQATQPAASDFFFNAKKLTGVY